MRGKSFVYAAASCIGQPFHQRSSRSCETDTSPEASQEQRGRARTARAAAGWHHLEEWPPICLPAIIHPRVACEILASAL